MKILFIEDDPVSLEYTRELLEAAGHEVTSKRKADDVLSILESIGQFQLVILDLMMRRGTLPVVEGEETGVELYRRIRNRVPEIRVLVYTGISKDEIWSHFRNDPKVNYFPKPILSNSDSFMRAVRGE